VCASDFYSCGAFCSPPQKKSGGKKKDLREGWGVVFSVVSNNQTEIKMNKHHEISAASFSAKTLKALAKKGLFLASSTFIPGPDGSFANGESAFLLSDGRLLTWIQVYKMAGV